MSRLLVHNPFGSLMQGRKFNVGGGYKYGFNTQEKEPELGQDVYTAEFWMYSAQLGRRWNVDVVLNVSLSSHCINHNNPLVFLDPFGNTDFYNTKGEWIGTDGDEKNTENKVITNRKIAKAIIKTSKKGADYKMELPNGSFQTLPDKVVLDLIVKTFNFSILKTPQDPDGNLHEASSRISADGEIESVIGYRPTEIWNCTRNGSPGIDADRHCIKSGKVSIHTHPIGLLNCGNEKQMVVDGSQPSPEDNATSASFDLNIIIGKDGNENSLIKTMKVDQNSVAGQGLVKQVEEFSDPREIRVFFFNKESKPLFDVAYDALKNIQTGSGKLDSKYHKKYESKKATETN